MFRIVRKVGLYEQIPWWYAPAWQDWCSGKYVCYPIGIHLLAAWLRRQWQRAIAPSKCLRAERTRYNQAWQSGFQAGINEGKRQVMKMAAEEKGRELANKIVDDLQHYYAVTRKDKHVIPDSEVDPDDRIRATDGMDGQAGSQGS